MSTLLTAVPLLVATTLHAMPNHILPYTASGTLTTAQTHSSSVTFTPSRRILHGYAGTVTIGNQEYVGNLYVIPSTQAVGLEWYQGKSGKPVGNAILEATTDSAHYTGKLQLTDRKARVLATGSMNLVISDANVNRP